MKITDIIEKIESKIEFGNIQTFSAKKHGNRIAVCRNNGEFHTDPELSGGGWATFLGLYTKADAIREFLPGVEF